MMSRSGSRVKVYGCQYRRPGRSTRQHHRCDPQADGRTVALAVPSRAEAAAPTWFSAHMAGILGLPSRLGSGPRLVALPPW